MREATEELGLGGRTVAYRNPHTPHARVNVPDRPKFLASNVWAIRIIENSVQYRFRQMNFYPIIAVTEDMIRNDEPMGSKDKFWCELPQASGVEGHWLFKHPRDEPGKAEHVAEKISCEIARLLRVECADVELAEFQKWRGTIARDFRKSGEVLVHGNEIIAGRVTDYDPERKRRTSDHTWSRIRQAISSVCGDRCEEDLGQLASYLLLDALIGNTDRHHENWGLLRSGVGVSASHRLAPSFDHASSLGREMLDERRVRLIKERKIEEYVRSGRGAIYLEELGEGAISPLTLVEKLMPVMSGHFRALLPNLWKVTDKQIDGILAAMPGDWMTEPQRDLSRAILRVSRDLLLKILT